jgi:pectate lyase
MRVRTACRSIQNSTSSRKLLGSCATGNPIDDCWRCDSKWEKNRKKLADCAIGFGRKAIGGRNGEIYVVTDASDNPSKPKRGTLRQASISN